jgi:hypothetical protein
MWYTSVLRILWRCLANISTSTTYFKTLQDLNFLCLFSFGNKSVPVVVKVTINSHWASLVSAWDVNLLLNVEQNIPAHVQCYHSCYTKLYLLTGFKYRSSEKWFIQAQLRIWRKRIISKHSIFRCVLNLTHPCILQRSFLYFISYIHLLF